MKLQSIAAAAMLALASAGACAGSATFINGLASFDSDAFCAPGEFLQSFSFSGLAAGTYDIVGDISATGLNFSGLQLDSAAWDLYADNKGNIRFGTIEVFAGSAPALLTVAGNVSSWAAAHFDGSISVTAVPEPGTYALMLAGLGALGFSARARKRA